jgi:ABC-type antimicrobial peptide transport system permease subunit
MNDFKLDNEPKITSGFTIPDGYFDTFSEKILAQIPIHEPKVISIFNITKTLYFVAAAIVIVMLSIPLYLKYSIKNQELDATTIENYIAYDSSISEDEIVDLLDKEDLVKMKIEFNLQDEDLETILSTNSNLEQYIIN